MSTRNAMERQLSPAFKEWQAARALEVAEEKRQSDAAQAAATAASPEAMFNELAIAEQGIALNVPLTDEYLESFGTIQRGPCTDDELEAAISYFKRSTKEYVHTQKNFDAILDFLERNSLNYGRLDSYRLAYAVLTHWAAFPDTEQPNPADFLKGYGAVNTSENLSEAQAQRDMDSFLQTTCFRKSNLNARLIIKTLNDAGLMPFEENLHTVDAFLRSTNAYPEPTTMTPSEIAEAKYKARMTEIVVFDPLDNRGYTEFDLEHCDSSKERRLRRLMEGRIGNDKYDEYLERRNIQHALDLARAKAAEETQ